ncbi:uncharacterized protein LOC144150972 [Haemaphysalis longicornis]
MSGDVGKIKSTAAVAEEVSAAGPDLPALPPRGSGLPRIAHVPYRRSTSPPEPEARVFSSLLRVFEAAEWDKVFVKMARVVVNYFTDMAFKVLFGSTGSRRRSEDMPEVQMLDRRRRRSRRDMAQYVLERQQHVSRLPIDCQRRIACRVGQHFGNINGLRALAPMLRTVDRSLVEAALHGLSNTDCDMAFPDCQLAS